MLFDFHYRSDFHYKSAFHSHAYHEVYYFHEGKCNYLIGDQIYELSPGDLILMHGMTLHCPKADRSVPYIRSIVHFEPGLLAPLTAFPGSLPLLQPFERFRNYRLSLRGAEKEEAERILLKMHGHQQAGSGVAGGRLLLAFADLLHFIYEQCLQPMREQRDFPTEKVRTVQAVIDLLGDSFAEEDLSMDKLQQRLHVSKSYLAKVFKEATGATIFEYLYRKRINEAKILFLFEPALSVTDVCFRLGFKHLAHFSRLFKQQVGQTPEQYRNGLKLTDKIE